MKKTFCILLTVIVIFAMGPTAFAAAPSFTSEEAEPEGYSALGLNDTEPYTCYANIDIYVLANQPTLTAESYTRTTSGKKIRDIDKIYVRGRLYKVVNGVERIVVDESQTKYDSADAKVQKVAGIVTEKKVAYGLHKYTSSGYKDVTLNTSKTK